MRHALRAAIVLITLVAALGAAMPVLAQETASTVFVAGDEATHEYPNRVEFTMSARATTEVTRVVLRYEVVARSCASVVTDVTVPSIIFTPGPSIQASWTMDMRRTGGLPPGARINYQWIVEDHLGNRAVSPSRTLTFDDNRYEWQTQGFNEAGIGEVRVHVYESGATISGSVLAAAREGLTRLRETTGIVPDRPIDVFVYNSSTDLQGALIFPQEWTGGVAFSAHNIVVIGITPDTLEWGLGATVHELTHIVLGQQAWTCLGRGMPTWLNEGLATYNEGPAGRQRYQAAVRDAVRQDRILPLRVLADSFPTDPQLALLAYGQSESVVSYLLERYGAEDIRAFVAAFGAGATVEEALNGAYGLDLAGLEAGWRKSIGVGWTPAPSPTPRPPEVVPTIPPFTMPGGVRATPTATPSTSPTSTPSPTPAGESTPSPQPPQDERTGGCNPFAAIIHPRSAVHPVAASIPLIILTLGAVGYGVRVRR